MIGMPILLWSVVMDLFRLLEHTLKKYLLIEVKPLQAEPRIVDAKFLLMDFEQTRNPLLSEPFSWYDRSKIGASQKSNGFVNSGVIFKSLQTYWLTG